MIVYCNGTAVIRHKSSGRPYKIESKQLDWDQVASNERDMGSELIYEAVLEHEQLGTLTWQLYEYPIGIENYKDTSVNGHIVVEDFDFGLLNDDDENFQENVANIVEWFYDNFEDPAEQTPFDSGEGGYQYIWGGPYDAQDVISERFDQYGDRIVEEAVKIVEKNGIVDWAPKDNTTYHSETGYLQEIENDTFNEISKEELTEKLVQQVSELQALIKPIIKSNPGIGHNNPPEETSDNEITYKHFEELDVISEELKDIAKSQLFDSEIFNKVFEKFKTVSTAIKNWILERLKKAIDKHAETAILLGGDYLIKHGHEIIDKIVNVVDSLSQFLH